MPTVLLVAYVVCAPLLGDVNVPRGDPVVVLRGEDTSQPITFLSWDTEGGDRATINLLYAPVSLWAQSGGAWKEVLTDRAQPVWTAARQGPNITIRVDAPGPNLERVRLVVDEFPRGAEFYDWSGNTTGYEGHLVYSFSFLQAVLYRDATMRRKVLGPLFAE